jgi:hypothetical protein
MESEMKKFLTIMLLILILLVSCGDNMAGKNAILDPYIAKWGTTTDIKEENFSGVLFYTYIWDGKKGHAKLIITCTKGKWEEAEFTSY